MLDANTPDLNAAIAIAKLSFEPIIADETASFSTKAGGKIQFDYADLEDIIPAVTPALSQNGLSICSAIVPINNQLFLVTTLLHSSGQQRNSFYPLPNTVTDPKEFGSQVTFGRRRNTVCLLEINVVESPEKKKQLRSKAANEMKRVVNDEMAEYAKQAPKPSKSAASKKTASPLEAVNKPDTTAHDETYLYPKHNLIIKRVRELLGVDVQWVSDYFKENFNNVPGNLPLESIEKTLIDWSGMFDLPGFNNEDEAMDSFKASLRIAGNIGNYELDKVFIDWFNDQIANNAN